jgi:hypothetical protein
MRRTEKTKPRKQSITYLQFEAKKATVWEFRDNVVQKQQARIAEQTVLVEGRNAEVSLWEGSPHPPPQ